MIHVVVIIVALLGMAVGLALGVCYPVGIRFFKQCPRCGSHGTESSRGWAVTMYPYHGREYVEHIQCFSCGKKSLAVLPQRLRLRNPFPLNL